MIEHKAFYSAENLKNNPFQTNPSADSDPRRGIWIGYPTQRDLLNRFLERTMADRVANINFVTIYGELGTGKTHALLWSHYQVMHEKKAEFDSVAYYIPTLLKDKARMSFARAFEEDIVEKSNLIQDVLTFKQFVQECVVKYKEDNKIGPELSLETTAEKLVNSTEFMNQLREILKCDSADDVRKMLEPDSDHGAVLLFCRLANLFVHPFELKAGIKRFKKGIYLLIDEVDELAKQSAKEAREVNGHFRHIYDFCPNCFFLGLGLTASAAELSVIFDDAVLSRISKQLVLEFLQPSEAKDFIKEVLHSGRVDGKRKKDYFPFTEDAIDNLVARIISITPRKIVNAMQQLLEETRTAGLESSKGPVSSAMLEKKQVWDVLPT